MLPAASMGQPPPGSGQRREEEGAVCAAKVKREIELFLSQRAHKIPMLPPRGTFRPKRKSPYPVDEWRESKKFGADFAGKRMQLCCWIVTLNFPQRRNQMNRISEKTEVYDNYFAGGATFVVEI